ncbi:MAG: adenylate/guanylate cyclase domain-containing protein [Tardiphaga sp.]
MAEAHVERRLAAILAADIAGYSALMGADEVRTVHDLKGHQAIVLPMVGEFGGRIIDTAGDGILAEFPSVVNAVKCAVSIQSEMIERNAAINPKHRMQFRVGINVGDVIYDEARIYGDGINVATRLEGIADPGGICISSKVYEEINGRFDFVFEDMGPQQLKNITRPVRAYRVRLDGRTLAAAPTLALPDKPSIAVLPFQNMSGDPEQDYFCDGLVEDIITTLSKLAGLRVIARNSTFVYKGRSVDIREAAKQLGVRYVLEGSVRKSGNRIRITAQLIDAQDGTHLWAERYDRAMDDIFAIQDEITLVLATELQVKLTEGEHARLHYTTTANVEAWTCWVQGLSHHRQAVTKDAQSQARFFWERALALDPASASLNAELGLLHSFDARFGWWDDRETAIEKALAYVDRALEIDPGNADAYTVSSLILLFQRQHDEAVAAARKAVELAPGSADTTELASHVLAASRYPEEAVVLSEKAMTLSPNYPAVYLGTLGNAYRLSGRTEQAIEAFQAYHARSPGFGLTDIVIAYQRTGRPEEARRAAEQLLAARPNFTVAAWLKTQFSYRDTAQVEADAAALRAAGFPLD